jgi:hypothetical protein
MENRQCDAARQLFYKYASSSILPLSAERREINGHEFLTMSFFYLVIFLVGFGICCSVLFKF